MREIVAEFKKIIKRNKRIVLIICFIFLVGLICGSLYITILKNNDKIYILDKINNFLLSNKKINLDDKMLIFRKSFCNNIIYFFSMWFLGISIVGIPIILIMIFFKSFVLGFSISSIYAKYKLKSLLCILIYLFPSNFLILIFSLFLAAYSSILSINLFINAFTKKTVNFGAFMGKYFFLLLLSILLSVFVSICDAFLSPILYNFYVKFIK